MTTMAALAAIERALRKGGLDTQPREDAERIAAAAWRHAVPARDLATAAADIRDWSRAPVDPLAVVVWRVLGDPGADVLELAIRLLGGDTGSTAAV
jgi:hypothetical protein